MITSAPQLIQLFDAASSTYTYLIFDPQSLDAVIIDPVIEQLERDQQVIDNGVPPKVLKYDMLLSKKRAKTSSTNKSIVAGDFSGRYIHYGVREHAMAAIMNGIALHKGFIPYSGTFLVFSDYMKPAIRLSALMRQQIIYVLTHDSIGLGEDGPTHQPVEHLAMLRAIPNLNVFRPADMMEVVGCYEQALSHQQTPSAMVLSRQDIKFLNGNSAACAFGGYVISDSNNKSVVTIIATGSEVGLAIDAQQKLEKLGIAAKVVSMPCLELFEQQNLDYQQQVLGDNNVLKVVVEAGLKQGWQGYLGEKGIFVGMSGFGASGKAEDLYQYFGITADNIVSKISSIIN